MKTAIPKKEVNIFLTTDEYLEMPDNKEKVTIDLTQTRKQHEILIPYEKMLERGIEKLQIKINSLSNCSSLRTEIVDFILEIYEKFELTIIICGKTRYREITKRKLPNNLKKNVMEKEEPTRFMLFPDMIEIEMVA